MQGKLKVEGLVIDNIYRVDSYIGSGAFGSLYYGFDIRNKKLLAIKLESKDVEAPQLPLEYRFYSNLGSQTGIPEVYHFGPCGLYHALVMELLGPSLDKMFVLCKKKFSCNTTTRIAKQLISIIEFIHNKKIIFRDIKPENFLLGRAGTPKANTIHIIDFGLAKDYIDRNTGKHIPMKTGKSLIGTPRYMSTWSHMGKEQGSLPWQGLKGHNNRRYKQIGKVKKGTTIEMLCSDIPEPFAEYMRYVRRLEFESDPNYQLLSNYFNELAADASVKWDWEDKRDNKVETDKESVLSTQTVGQRTVS